jgi:alpha-L-arabinofuranosidase
MKKELLKSAACALLLVARLAFGEEARITVNADKVVRQIDDKIYGHFLEHIYHSVNGGLWGEVVWNRSFEEALSKESWSVVGGVIDSPSKVGDESRFDFGELTWKEIEVSVEVQRTAKEGALLLDFHTHDGRYTLVLGEGED